MQNDELVERWAAALWEAPLPTPYGEGTRISWASLLELACVQHVEERNVIEYRAMASAIIPLALEHAAAVADADYAPAYGDPYLDGQNVASKRIAAAIRGAA